MTPEEMIELCKAHTLFTWKAQQDVNPIPMQRAEGVYFWDAHGKRFLDWNSQIMSVHVGHQHPKIVAALKKQADTLCYAAPSMATEIRARLGQRLARLSPASINTFFFALGGAEANENAVRLARLYTGRHKVLAGYRSYHGATHLSASLTGDPRRWPNEPAATGILHFMGPELYRFSFGDSEAKRAENALAYLEELIEFEGPHTIAAILLEAVPGTNGVLVPPPGYLEGVRALCDRHGILLIFDEVMTGFGRTGKMMAFEHFHVVPDLFTGAKGLTSSYLPLGVVGISDAIRSHFESEVYWGGLTFNAHPMSLAAAEANLQVIEEEGLVDHARSLHPLMTDLLTELAQKHPSVRAHRSLGLFGMMDFCRNADGDWLAPYGKTHPAMSAFSKGLLKEGLYAYARWSSLMSCPPLIITETQLREGFAVIDQALHHLDEAMDGSGLDEAGEARRAGPK